MILQDKENCLVFIIFITRESPIQYRLYWLVGLHRDHPPVLAIFPSSVEIKQNGKYLNVFASFDVGIDLVPFTDTVSVRRALASPCALVVTNFANISLRETIIIHRNVRWTKF